MWFKNKDYSDWWRILKSSRYFYSYLVGRINLEISIWFSFAWKQNKLRQELANFFCNRPDSKYFRLSWPVSFSTAQICCHSIKAAIDNMWTNGHGCVAIKLLRTLKFGFHRFFSCIIKYYSFGFLSAIKKHKKPFLEPMGCQENRWWVLFGCSQGNMGNSQFSLMG